MAFNEKNDLLEKKFKHTQALDKNVACLFKWPKKTIFHPLFEMKILTCFHLKVFKNQCFFIPLIFVFTIGFSKQRKIQTRFFRSLSI